MKEEEKILESVADKTALKGVAELAKGIEYTDPIKTGYVNECYDRASYTNFRCRCAAAGQYGIALHRVMSKGMCVSSLLEFFFFVIQVKSYRNY